jgi:hypothetical protein
VQGDETGFSKLRVPNAQDAIGQDVGQPEVEGLGYPQAGGRDEPKQRRVHLPSQRVRGSKATRRLDNLSHLLVRVEVRQEADLWAVEEIRWRDFMNRVLDVEEARCASNVLQPNMPRLGGGGLSGPLDGCGHADVRITFRRREGRERTKLSRGVVKLEAERLPKAHVPFNVIGQHDETSGHGCAISDRRPKSTLA